MAYVTGKVLFRDVVVGEVKLSFNHTSTFKKPGHTHIFCPCCGTVWGKVLVDANYNARHWFVNGFCDKHSGGLFITEHNAFDWYAAEWSAGVYAHDFAVIYDNWLVSKMPPVREGEGWLLNIGGSQNKLAIVKEDKNYREV